MENAPKALIMSATMIIAVMMFAIMVHVFRAGANLDATFDLEQTKDSLSLYNAKFEVYNRDELSIFDIITVANLAYNINCDCNFDVAKAVQITINIGGKYYVIPRKEPVIYDKDRKRIIFGRNKIFSLGNVYNTDGDVTGGQMISIYDLVDKTMGELEINIAGIAGMKEADKLDKLSTSQLGSAVTQNSYGVDVERHNATVYKYLFKSNGAEYNNSLGRLIKMEFELTGINSNWKDT